MALTGLAMLLPFALFHCLQGRHLLGAGSLAVLALLCVLALGSRNGRRPDRWALALLIPVTTVFLAVGVILQGSTALSWAYPTVLAYYCILEERQARVANLLALAIVLPAAFTHLESTMALRAGATLVTTSVFVAILVRTIERQQARLRERADTDPLTGLSNRHGLAEALSAAATAESALLVVDLDHFKRVNDDHGHAAGDAVLRGAGALLSTLLRPGERAFRTGGEEFLLLLEPGPETEHAHRAERIREALAGNEPPGGLPPVTASIGLARARDDESVDAWVGRADAAVYRAKAAGRDRVMTG